MTNEEIQKECERMYEQIKSAEARLKEIRSLCPHEKTFKGNYQWGGVGHIAVADTCEYCNEPVKFY